MEWLTSADATTATTCTNTTIAVAYLSNHMKNVLWQDAKNLPHIICEVHRCLLARLADLELCPNIV